ncbi:hypothetical protein B9Z19DRAFT_1110521, partial [Tuber borchii]
MDHVVEPSRIGAAGTTRALQEFKLVSFDTFGAPQPLPPGLGDLPLYLDNDGFRSVNGPRDFAALPLCSAVAPLSHDCSAMIETSATVISGLTGKNLCISSSHTKSYLDDAISSGQRAHSTRRGYLCREPGCTWRASFPTKQALDRHHEVKHLNKRVD